GPGPGGGGRCVGGGCRGRAGGGGGGGFDFVHLDGAVTGDDGTDQLFGGSGTDSLGNGFSVDLLEHEGIDGGHAITYHVSKSDTFLINVARLRQLDAQDEYFNNRKLPNDGVRVGSFSSLSSANKLVNSTLSENADRVRQVASGRLLHAFVSKNFGSITGKEAYAPSLWGGITIRETRSVGVYIIHSANSRTGFRIHTAYPIR
ncbi:RNase A-like domain-containing protein, partial [Nostoc sp. NIES-2111]